jgi:hypothetical protein
MVATSNMQAAQDTHANQACVSAAAAAADLAEAAVDALCHVDVVAGGAPAAILTLLRLNSDGLSSSSSSSSKYVLCQLHTQWAQG